MRKAKGIILYNAETNQVYKFSVLPVRGEDEITLISSMASSVYSKYFSNNDLFVEPYKYPSFSEMYTACLKTARNNGFYFGTWRDFGTTWYDITFIDINKPYNTRRYSLS